MFFLSSRTTPFFQTIISYLEYCKAFKVVSFCSIKFNHYIAVKYLFLSDSNNSWTQELKVADNCLMGKFKLSGLVLIGLSHLVLLKLTIFSSIVIPPTVSKFHIGQFLLHPYFTHTHLWLTSLCLCTYWSPKNEWLPTSLWQFTSRGYKLKCTQGKGKRYTHDRVNDG